MTAAVEGRRASDSRIDAHASEATDAAGALVLEERFSIVPEWVLDADISDAAVRLYAVLLRYGQSSGQRMPSRRTLAARLRKRSVDSVDRALKELVAVGAVEVTRRSRDGLNLTNRYLVRSTFPGGGRRPFEATTPAGGRTDAAIPARAAATADADALVEAPRSMPKVGAVPRRGGRRSAARGGRLGAARVAARLRPDPESLTEISPPPGPSSTAEQRARCAVDVAAGVDAHPESPAGQREGRREGAGRVARRASLLAALGLEDLTEVAARCARVRADRGLPVALWTADRLTDVLADAVLDAGWPAGSAVTALVAVAADPATRSPARLSCPGPWWDAAAGKGAVAGAACAGAACADEVAELEAVLAEAGGLRVTVQRQARAELAAEGVPVTRASVSRRAVELLGRRGSGGTVSGGAYRRDVA